MRMLSDSAAEILVLGELHDVLKCVDGYEEGLGALREDSVDRRDERHAQLSADLAVALGNLLICRCFGNAQLVDRQGIPHDLTLQGKKGTEDGVWPSGT